MFRPWLYLTLSLLHFHTCFAVTFTIAKNNSSQLQHAIMAAQNGDTIILKGGQYRGHFTLRHRITLKGEASATLTAIANQPILEISAPHVNIKNLRVNGEATTGTHFCLRANKQSAYLHLQSNFFRNCAFAIALNQSDHARIENNTIQGRHLALLQQGNLIQVQQSHHTVIKNNRLQWGRDAIYLTHSRDATLRHNKIRHVYFGVHVMESTHCQIIRNQMKQSTVGMAIMNASQVIIRNNQATHNHLYGYLLREVHDAAFQHNQALENVNGLMLSGSYHNKINNNQIAHNRYGVVISFGSHHNHVYHNNFIENRLQIRYANMGSTHWGYQGQGNYWSNYPGFNPLQKDVGPAPFYVTNLAQWLSFSFPSLNIMFDSPVMQVLQKVENNFPVLRQTGLIDDYPLTKRVSDVR